MTSWNLDAVLALCAKAGEIALRYFDSPTTDYKSDDTLVTQADQEIEEFLSRHFDRPNEGSYLVGEETIEKRETEYLSAAVQESAWIVDPIDGTMLYANHLHDWGVSIGFMQEGVIREGAVYFPLSEEIVVSELGRVFFGKVKPGESAAANDGEGRFTLRVLEPPRPKNPKSRIVCVNHALVPGGFPIDSQSMVSGSAVYPLVSVALGRMTAYVGRLNLWDLAGALPLLLNLGATITLQDGTPLTARVDTTGYDLAFDEPRRLRTRGHMIASFDEETHHRIREVLDAVVEHA